MREEDEACINAENAIISDFSVDNASDCDDELEYTQYSCYFVTPNRFSVLNSVIDDEISLSSNTASGAVKTAAGKHNNDSCSPCERSHKCFNCTDKCQDSCELVSGPGPMMMKCYVCRKKFSNQDFMKQYIEKG